MIVNIVKRPEIFSSSPDSGLVSWGRLLHCAFSQVILLPSRPCLTRQPPSCNIYIKSRNLQRSQQRLWHRRRSDQFSAAPLLFLAESDGIDRILSRFHRSQPCFWVLLLNAWWECSWGNEPEAWDCLEPLGKMRKRNKSANKKYGLCNLLPIIMSFQKCCCFAIEHWIILWRRMQLFFIQWQLILTRSMKSLFK